jgi:hypothetical protein
MPKLANAQDLNVCRRIPKSLVFPTFLQDSVFRDSEDPGRFRRFCEEFCKGSAVRRWLDTLTRETDGFQAPRLAPIRDRCCL